MRSSLLDIDLGPSLLPLSVLIWQMGKREKQQPGRIVYKSKYNETGIYKIIKKFWVKLNDL